MNAFFAALLVTIFLFTGWWFIIVLLALDFFARAGKWGRYSMLGFISDRLISRLQISHKPVDRAPKRFAAWIGFGFCTGILLLLLGHLPLAAIIAAGVLVTFALLEALFGFCAGCYVYSAGLLLFKKEE